MLKYLDSPIIFFGFGRSGTTIISNTVFEHPELGWVSNYQEKFPRSRAVNLIRNLQDNSLWKVKKQKFQSGNTSFFSKFLFLPGESYSFWNWLTQRDFGRNFFWNQPERENRERIRKFCNSIVKFQGRERFAFKITGPSRLEYLHSIFPDAKFVWIKRKPLPNIRSLLKVDFYQDRKQKLWWKGDVYSKKELEKATDWRDKPELIAALQYFKIHEVFKYEQEKLNIENNIYEINYEDFISNSSLEIKKLLNFLNLNYHKDIKEYLSDKTIYNSNKKEDFYISPELDNTVLQIANNGLN